MGLRARTPYPARETADVPRRMLSLDGGGIRGVLTLEVLARLEAELRAAVPGADDDFVLADWFDYIGGTSTGGIIAAGLALGLPVARLQRLYAELGPKMFRRTPTRAFWNLYPSQPITTALYELFGDRSLGSDDLRTLLLVVMKNRTTDSPWPVTNCTRAAYNDRDACAAVGRVSNLDAFSLVKVVRASTAAPVFFPPERIPVPRDRGERATDMVFVDGGVSPFNNPALQLFLMATHPAYRLEWPTGPDRLLLVSVGTGSQPRAFTSGRYGSHLLRNLRLIPVELLGSTAVAADVMCRALGHCTYGQRIDSELGDMAGTGATRERSLFTYVRYDATLTRGGLDELGLRDVDPRKVARLAGVSAIGDLGRIGRAVAERVSLDHVAGFVA